MMLWRFLIGFFILIFIIGCTSDNRTDVNASGDENSLKNINVATTNASATQPVPWSNTLIWKQLDESKSNASFSSEINDQFAPMTFTISGKFKEKDFIPTHVQIRDSSDGKIIQKLNAKDRFDNHGNGYSEISLFFADLVQLIDLNSDGYLDLRLLFETGATGNNWYATYLYQPKTKKFRYHNNISLLSGITQDTDSKTIKTYWRGGWCWECREYFRLNKNGRLVLDKLEWTEIDKINTSSGCLVFTGRPKDRNAVYLGYAFYHMDQSDFEKYIRKRVNITDKKELTGSLDGRTRNPLGTPYN